MGASVKNTTKQVFQYRKICNVYIQCTYIQMKILPCSETSKYADKDFNKTPNMDIS